MSSPNKTRFGTPIRFGPRASFLATTMSMSATAAMKPAANT
jgi:hypothetical protein